MSPTSFKNLNKLVTQLRDDLNNHELVLLYAFNRTGKTRLSMAFKDHLKTRNKQASGDTLYFNAYTEDLFTWENDLENDTNRGLKLNHNSKFFDGFSGLEPLVYKYLNRYTDFDFNFYYLDVQQGQDIFSKPAFVRFYKKEKKDEDIKISRGEECLFIWCLFMAICERVLNSHESYKWVEYIYIDDPISSLDDDNAIAVACDLAQLIRQLTQRKTIDTSLPPIKIIVSSHHSTFFNVMCNEISRPKEEQPKVKHKRYFLHRLALKNQEN